MQKKKLNIGVSFLSLCFLKRNSTKGIFVISQTGGYVFRVKVLILAAVFSWAKPSQSFF